jgi:hypothetical protein
MSEFSFMRGLSQVQQKDAKAIRKELMTALKIKTRMAFFQRAKGKIVPRVPEAKAIDEIFIKYGITDIWGEALTSDSSEK